MRWRSLLVPAVATTLIVVGILALLVAFTPFYHDRKALGAFTKWRQNPSPETERIWIAERDRAARREARFRGGALGLGLAAGGAGIFLIWRRRKKAARRGAPAPP